jgi:hypothetical protein
MPHASMAGSIFGTSVSRRRRSEQVNRSNPHASTAELMHKAHDAARNIRSFRLSAVIPNTKSVSGPPIPFTRKSLTGSIMTGPRW